MASLLFNLFMGVAGDKVVEKAEEMVGVDRKGIKRELNKHLDEYESTSSWRYGGIYLMLHGAYLWFDKHIKEHIATIKKDGFSKAILAKLQPTYPLSIMLSGLGIYLVNKYLMMDKSKPLTIGFGIVAGLSFIM